MLRRASFRYVFAFTLSALLVSACSASPGGSPKGGGPGEPLPPKGPYASLQGIWQETRASSGDFRNPTTGYEFSATEGFSTQLIIGADGSYYQVYYSSGYHQDCTAPITYTEQSDGTVAVDGSRLTLQPSHHQVVVTGCNGSTVDLGSTAIGYSFDVRQEFFEDSGRKYYMNLVGGPHPLELELLHHAPASPGLQPSQPADFELGTYTMFTEFVGTWTPSPGSLLDFYDPDTNEYYVPAKDGNEHAWLRFYDDPDTSYELASLWRDPYGQGVCRKDHIYWERGKSTFALLESDATSAFTHVRFEASDARLIVVISNCGELSQAVGYELTPLTTYYRLRYSADLGESISLNCNWDRSEWQYMLCGATGWTTFTRR